LKKKVGGGCALPEADMQKQYASKCGEGKIKIDLFRDFLQKLPIFKLWFLFQLRFPPCIYDRKLCKLSIDLEELSKRHTGENLCEQLKTVLDKWKIPLEKIQMAITDDGANMVKAVSLLLGASKHLPCFAHTISLIPKKVCEDPPMEPLISSVKSIVRYFNQSNLASAELKKLQESSNNKNNLKLIQSNDTRWNSTFYMLDRLLELSDLLGVALLK
jgi:hypothetical protein